MVRIVHPPRPGHAPASHRERTVAHGQVRRFWSDDEKRRIVAQSCAPGISVSVVARRYDVNANPIFTWRRDPCYQPAADDAPSFLPVEVVPEPSPLTPAASEGRIEIALSNGHRMSATGSFDADALCRVVRARGG